MKIQELLMAIHCKDFNMEKEIQVKKYLPIEEKKLIAKGIIYECTEEVNGVIKVDSVQQYLSYVKYMILRHTNLEYTPEDYDILCSNNLLNDLMECFGEDAQECSRILNLMMDDYMQESTIEFTVTMPSTRYSKYLTSSQCSAIRSTAFWKSSAELLELPKSLRPFSSIILVLSATLFSLTPIKAIEPSGFMISII